MRVLLLPGLGGVRGAPWPSRWACRHGHELVEQHDWDRPLRGDWIARLEDGVLASEAPCVLVADGLGCILVAAWAAHTKNAARVRGALLVAPEDPAREALATTLRTWQPVPLQPLPFPAALIAADQDTRCASDRVQRFASAWGARTLALRAPGPQAGPGEDADDWPEGHRLLQALTMDGWKTRW